MDKEKRCKGRKNSLMQISNCGDPHMEPGNENKKERLEKWS
jgi:hypothetical protein